MHSACPSSNADPRPRLPCLLALGLCRVGTRKEMESLPFGRKCQASLRVATMQGRGMRATGGVTSRQSTAGHAGFTEAADFFRLCNGPISVTKSAGEGPRPRPPFTSSKLKPGGQTRANASARKRAQGAHGTATRGDGPRQGERAYGHGPRRDARHRQDRTAVRVPPSGSVNPPNCPAH